MSDYIILESGRRYHYDTHHSNLRRKFGKANKCEFCNSKIAKRYEWALKKGKKHSLNKSNYYELCPSCHRKYDMTDDIRHRMSASKKGRVAVNKVSVINSNGDIFDSITDAQNKTGILRTSIHNCLTNKSKTAGGLQWKRV